MRTMPAMAHPATRAALLLALLLLPACAQRLLGPDDLESRARGGDVDALCALYLLHETGDRPAQDEAEALGWLRRAAEGGQADAMFYLGTRLAEGRDAPKNETQAALWFRRAAERGQARAQLALGVMQVTGRGTPRDRVEALMWITLAERGLEGEERALAAGRRVALSRALSEAEITEAQRRAAAWRPRAE